ncbi:PE-PPE domain-containing protein [Arthrobacter sp. ISL-69]|uniref:PE-PPE domain-containing protein n=1 Tax=Arthrobacter sp. ISL-69 TaxID=2819113 RepID=UPI001BEBC056|nr:PE-PPE domain-containing protein [Arthrobacter sp. ISL-69]MBT2537802.1 hypothetical protein [Arthrobacter sp. ISL-69]
MAEATPSGSSGPLAPLEPATDGDMRIRGGVGGIRFQLEELIAGAAELEGLADELAAVEIGVRRIWEELCPYQYEPRPSGTAALIAVGEGGQSVRAVREELQHLSSQVRASRRDYEEAEARAATGVPQPQDGWAFLPLLFVDLTQSNFLSRDAAEALAPPLSLGLALGIAPKELSLALAAEMAAGREFSAIGPLIRRLAEGSFPMLKPRQVTAVEELTRDVAVDTSPAGLLARLRELDADGHGRIEVVQVENGGRRAFVVIIPGTQPGEPPGGSNPLDEAGIAEALGYGSEHVNAAVLSALHQAGAVKGDQVVAVGYSQGGAHAMNLSSDRAFLAEFDLNYVLTAGSPVGGITPQPGIPSLHLEHRQDWVPGSDGTLNPDTRDRVTVTLTGREVTPPGEDPGLGPGHKLANYEAGAKAVSASENSSLAASTAVLAGVLGAGGTGTATRFALNREPLATPASKPGPPPSGAAKWVAR